MAISPTVTDVIHPLNNRSWLDTSMLQTKKIQTRCENFKFTLLITLHHSSNFTQFKGTER